MNTLTSYRSVSGFSQGGATGARLIVQADVSGEQVRVVTTLSSAGVEVGSSEVVIIPPYVYYDRREGEGWFRASLEDFSQELGLDGLRQFIQLPLVPFPHSDIPVSLYQLAELGKESLDDGTALHLSVKGSWQEIMEWLDKEGKLPDVAARLGNVLELIISFVDTPPEPLEVWINDQGFIRRVFLRYATAGGLVSLVADYSDLNKPVTILAPLTFKEAPALTRKGPGPGERPLLQPPTHIQPGESHPPYSSVPPTSGWHYATTAPWGISQTPIAEEIQVHNLEHGGVIIQYNTRDRDLVQRLEELARKQADYPCYLIVAPYPNMGSAIALTAWGVVLYLQQYDETAIQEFIDAYRKKGPEVVACTP